jgi:hypothetical protein
MKKLYLNTDNVFALDSVDVDDDTFNVQLSIVGEDGNVLTDNEGNDLILSSLGADPELTFDTDLNQFIGTIHLATTTPRQYARAFWVVTDTNNLPIALAGYYPEEISIENDPSDATQTYRQMIVPKAYFTNTFLGNYPSFSGLIVNILAEIEARDPNTLGNMLLASQGELEKQIRTRFFKTQFSLDKDMYDEDFRQSHWLQQPDVKPLISCDSFRLIYGNNDIVLSNDIADSIWVDKNLGTFEWMPLVTSTTLFTMIISTLSGLAITSYASDYASRIPGLFRIIYTAGMDFPNLPDQDKESIRKAICRNSFMMLKPLIDPIMRERSISKSIDGASKSVSGGLDLIIKQFKEDEKEWISLMQKELGTTISFAVS